jgi:hypothetical protein
MHLFVSLVSFFRSLNSATLCNKSKCVVGSSNMISGVSCARARATNTFAIDHR